MIRANLYHFLELGAAIQRFKTFTAATKGSEANAIEVYFELLPLKTSLVRLLENSDFLHITKHPLFALSKSINAALEECQEKDGQNSLFSSFKSKVYTYNLRAITRELETFEHVFAAECLDTPSYVVEKIGIFNTKDLVENTVKQIPQELLLLMTESVRTDFENAGRCLAFKLNNASAFHSLRAVEGVLHDYVAHYVGEKITSECKSWAHYVSKLNECQKDKSLLRHPSKKVIRNIDQMRDLDRNPIMHPRDNLTSSEAFILFQNATVAIISMISDINETSPQQGDLLEALPGSDKD